MERVVKRNKTIDVARGIAILLVILGHSFYTLDEPLNKVILAFHMPLFFFISGLVAKTANMVKMNNKWGYTFNKVKSFFYRSVF